MRPCCVRVELCIMYHIGSPLVLCYFPLHSMYAYVR